MSNQKRSSEEDETRAQKEQSSQGIHPVSQTPKDVSPEDAASKDVTHRNLRSDDPDEKEEESLDDAVELTFPASDPVSAAGGGVTRIEVPKQP
ncbi:hypothetical protein [Noviherbaspirillum denitrificans]|uniref:Uncharacterized protein n=1 Tax=Noviherbaspirillum denitrificans TaxID=1968433 RepID=A0A254THK3_9BURK|nr:hypothetical protein [Noviherbaspirillum denitrificans]OWW21657.1 hypothetical protein AYR66_21380 [Noviherbaspirillum denitrificans]